MRLCGHIGPRRVQGKFFFTREMKDRNEIDNGRKQEGIGLYLSDTAFAELKILQEIEGFFRPTIWLDQRLASHVW